MKWKRRAGHPAQKQHALIEDPHSSYQCLRYMRAYTLVRVICTCGDNVSVHTPSYVPIVYVCNCVSVRDSVYLVTEGKHGRVY